MISINKIYDLYCNNITNDVNIMLKYYVRQ